MQVPKEGIAVPKGPDVSSKPDAGIATAPLMPPTSGPVNECPASARPESDNAVMTTADAADLMGISPRHVRRLMQRGVIPPYCVRQVGAGRFLNPEQLKKWFKESKWKPARPWSPWGPREV